MPRLTLSRFLSAVFFGLIVSMTSTFGGLFLLSAFLIFTDELFSATVMQYLILTLTLISIFVGSLLAAYRAGVKGLIVGITVGFLYICLSITIGKNLSHEEMSLLLMLNKILAGVFAGALGGLVGVNL